MKLKSFLLAAEVVSSVLIVSCGRKAKEKRVIMGRDVKPILAVKEEES